MARAKKIQEKPTLERIYTIPLRKQVRKAPRYKKSKKAIRTIKEFLAKHMKVPDRELKKIKIDKWVNEAIWIRGIKKPPQKIIIKAIKDFENNVKVEFVGLPPKFKVDEEKLKKKIEKIKKREEEKAKTIKEKKREEEKKKAEEKKSEEKTEEGKKTEKEKKAEENKERKEKEKELHKEITKPKAELKHEMKRQKGKPVIQRKALEK